MKFFSEEFGGVGESLGCTLSYSADAPTEPRWLATGSLVRCRERSELGVWSLKRGGQRAHFSARTWQSCRRADFQRPGLWLVTRGDLHTQDELLISQLTSCPPFPEAQVSSPLLHYSSYWFKVNFKHPASEVLLKSQIPRFGGSKHSHPGIKILKLQAEIPVI